MMTKTMVGMVAALVVLMNFTVVPVAGLPINAWSQVAAALDSQTSIYSLVTYDDGTGNAVYGGTSNGGRLFKAIYPPITSLPPVASFIATPYVGAAPLTVTFTDKSQYNPTKYLWSFGDGTTSTLKTPPRHLYSKHGIYHVGLTVYNSVGYNSTVQDVVVLPKGLWKK